MVKNTKKTKNKKAKTEEAKQPEEVQEVAEQDGLPTETGQSNKIQRKRKRSEESKYFLKL